MKGIINVKCIALLVPDSFFRSELLVCQLTLHTPHTHLPLHVACTLDHLKDHVRAVLFCLHAFWLVLLSCLPACLYHLLPACAANQLTQQTDRVLHCIESCLGC